MVFRFAAILPVNRWVAFRQRGNHPKGSVVQVRANQPLKMVFPGASARGPPAWDDALDYVAPDCDALAQPEPEYLFDQQVQW